MQTKVYKPVVARLVAEQAPARVLDLPSGNGWLASVLADAPPGGIDGIDLYEDKPPGYARFWQADLDRPLPAPSDSYDAVVSCEGIEHLGNPLLFLGECCRVLVPGGRLIITTPNVWNPASKLKYALRGFFPGFPSLAGRIAPGTHMHLTPFSYPALYLFATLAGFEAVRLVATGERVPRRAYERPLGWPQKRYCRRRQAAAVTPEQAAYWRDAGCDQSVYGRALVVTARKPG
ncbi:methyltransferase domain-containing protein [Aquibium sp. A9E412]|uniref:class I SAM-dependent methyltransferase n=1 Tax=Aquibium sp. A9E412 TaxID=2976767 RepID=UPI0025AEFB12|nr:class I SAM-dependent methyltransferase [Aquibium sp. A9E412]MDN2566351.1 methyltransferase domain-containing protein [Aquibium sp. A9E412]